MTTQSQSPAAVTSVIIYTNDGTELSFSDGTKLELSACGASFACQRAATRGQHPLDGGTRIQQRTEFTTSEFKEKVRQALECRNRFADRPYLCRQFLQKDATLQLFADINAVKWPKSTEKLHDARQLDGSVKITSVDECASLLLSENKEEFTVEFLCKLSQKEFPRRAARKLGKLHQQTDPDAVGRPSTDLQSDINRPTAFGRPSTDLTAAHSSAKISYDDQDSPYLQTLIQRKDPLRNYKTREKQRQPSVASGVERGITDTQGMGYDFQDFVSQNPEIEEMISIKHGYTWVIQHHTVERGPECWKHPLQLALNFDPNKLSSTLSSNGEPNKGLGVSDTNPRPLTDPLTSRVLGDLNVNNNLVTPENECLDKTLTTRQESQSDVVTSTLPSPLPLSCGAGHLHKWRKEAGARGVDVLEEDVPVGQSIKVWFSNGIIYRLSRTPRPAVHVYPGDGTIIKSKGGRGGFFTQVIPQNGSLQERMLCVRSPPPDGPGAKYSLAGILRKATRLLQNMMQADVGLSPFQREEKCCWKEASRSCLVANRNPTAILEESKVEGLGSFVAFSNGRVRIVYDDRTALDMEWDFRSRLEENNSDNPDSQKLPVHRAAPKIRKSVFKSGLRKGVCKLLLPNGEQILVALENPHEYQRYVTVAVEWATWVASSPEERLDFYKFPESNSSCQESAVQTELQKIKCFEYIIENTLSPVGEETIGLLPMGARIPTGGTTGVLPRPTGEESSLADPTPDFVRDALRRTCSTIENIDSLLGKF